MDKYKRTAQAAGAKLENPQYKMYRIMRKRFYQHFCSQEKAMESAVCVP